MKKNLKMMEWAKVTRSLSINGNCFFKFKNNLYLVDYFSYQIKNSVLKN